MRFIDLTVENHEEQEIPVSQTIQKVTLKKRALQERENAEDMEDEGSASKRRMLNHCFVPNITPELNAKPITKARSHDDPI